MGYCSVRIAFVVGVFVLGQLSAVIGDEAALRQELQRLNERNENLTSRVEALEQQRDENLKTGGTVSSLISKFDASFQNVVKTVVVSWHGAPIISILLLLFYHGIVGYHEVASTRASASASSQDPALLLAKVDGESVRDWFFSFVRKVGQSMIVAQLYFHDPWKDFVDGSPFLYSCLFLFVDTVAIYIIRRTAVDWAARCCTEPGHQGLLHPPNPEILNHYMDLGMNVRVVFVFFIGQTFLMLCYFTYVNSDSEMSDASTNFTKWFFAVVIVHIAGVDNMGSSFQDSYWRGLKSNVKRNMEERDYQFFYNRRKWGVYGRTLMDFFINGLCRAVLIGTVPILSCVQENDMDFIKDILATFFVLRLDEKADAVDFRQMLNNAFKRDALEITLRDVESLPEPRRRTTLVELVSRYLPGGSAHPYGSG